MVLRSIVSIDEQLCNGCGRCVIPCAEGVIEMINGKARVLKEELCDGLGFCVGICPTGALSIEKRDAAAFDEAAAKTNSTPKIVARCYRCGSLEEDRILFPVRVHGRSDWVCARCLPPLIHG